MAFDEMRELVSESGRTLIPSPLVGLVELLIALDAILASVLGPPTPSAALDRTPRAALVMALERIPSPLLALPMKIAEPELFRATFDRTSVFVELKMASANRPAGRCSVRCRRR
ncbi:hypothetical protein [Streptomyces tailanensis]|uniref:hypothetical protein n=1 Tax=Streptomyces tailanensis TaxID=2569858 RepID=UPI00122DEFBF|nr:hypothetical protein [Streptomyces tailanensis]